MNDKQMREAMTGGTSSDMALWHKVCTKAEQRRDRWVSMLRTKGVAAAHPNDGWVNRDLNEFRLCYPQFNDGVDVGSVVALGWDFDKTYRLVRVTEVNVSKLMGGVKYKFEKLSVESNV